MNGDWKMFDESIDSFFDVRIWKDEIESLLDMQISDDEFDKIMESFDVFHLDDLIHGYIKQNKEVIVQLINDGRDMK